MPGLTKLEPIISRQPMQPRLWLVFFSDGEVPRWWWPLFAKGFRHVSAAAWYGDRWVYFNPGIQGLDIELFEQHEFGLFLDDMIGSGATILRMRSRFGRGWVPASWFCVGAAKALLGVKSRALGPRQLMRDLLSIGAETIEVPVGKPVKAGPATHAADPAGRPGGQAAA